MVSTTTDCSRNFESHTNTSELSGLAENAESSSSERTNRDCEINYNERDSANLTCRIAAPTLSSEFVSSNMMTKLKGQKWQHFFDYEKVLAQLRYLEMVNIKKLDLSNQASSSEKTAHILDIGGDRLNSRQAMRQVQRLNGNDMQYYGLAPKQEALEIAICNICNGIYTKVGFNNHMVQQHPSVWSTLPNMIIKMSGDMSVKSPTNNRYEELDELEGIELIGISTESSVTVPRNTVSASLSSSSSSIFSSSTNSVKGYRYNNNNSIRTKLPKQHKKVPSSTTLTNSAVLSKKPASAELAIAITNGSSLLSKYSKSAILPTPNSYENASVKLLTTYENATDATQSSNNSPTAFSSFSNLSNSSNSSSSVSSTMKTLSQTTKSSPSLTFPTLLFTEASNNATAPFDIVSHPNAYSLESSAKSLRGTEFDAESHEKTEHGSSTTNIFNIKDISPNSVNCRASVPTDANKTNNSSTNTNEMINNRMSGMDSILSPPTLTCSFSDEQYARSQNNEIITKGESLPIDSGISPRSDIELHDSNHKKLNIDSEAFQLENVAKTRITTFITEETNSPYQSKLAPMKNFHNNRINFDTNENDSSATNPTQGVVDFSCDKDVDRQNLLGSLSVNTDVQCALMQNSTGKQRSINNNPFNNNVYTMMKLTKPEKTDMLLRMPLYSGTSIQKFKLESTDKKEERPLNHYTSKENSIVAIDNIFEHNTTFELLDNSSSACQNRMQQPATKRLRLDVKTFHTIKENDKAFTCLPSMQRQVLEQLPTWTQGTEQQRSNPNITGQRIPDDVDVQHQTEICNMSHETEQISYEDIHLQQFLLKHCSFKTDIVDQPKDQHQMNAKDFICSGKEINDISTKDICLSNGTNTLELSNIATKNEILLINETCKELNTTGHNISEGINWRSNLISLTDQDDEEEETTKYLKLPTESEIIYELETSSENAVQQKRKKHLYNRRSFEDATEMFSYNFSLIETKNFSSLLGNRADPKSGQEIFTDTINYNISMCNRIPRPLTVNNFGFIKLPLTTATTFRKVVLTSRKANNNPITFSNNSNAVVVNSTSNSYIGCTSPQNNCQNIGNLTKNINTAALNACSTSVEQFSVNISNPATNYLHVQQQQQNNNCFELAANTSNYNAILSSTSNANGQRAALNRHQKATINSALNWNTCENVKKAYINNSSPVAIVKPATLLQITAQSNKKSNNDSSYNSAANITTIYIHSSCSLGTDRVKLNKRPPVAKLPNTLKQKFYTPKKITELLGVTNSLTADFLGVFNGNCDTASKSYPVDCYRNARLHSKRNLFKPNHQRVKMTSAALKMVRETKHQMR